MRNPRVSQQHCTAVMTTAHVRIVHFSTRIPLCFFHCFFPVSHNFLDYFWQFSELKKSEVDFLGRFFLGTFLVCFQFKQCKPWGGLRGGSTTLPGTQIPWGFFHNKKCLKKTHAPMILIGSNEEERIFFRKILDLLSVSPELMIVLTFGGFFLAQRPILVSAGH